MHCDRLSRTLVPMVALNRFHAECFDGLNAVNRLNQHRLAFAFGMVERFQSFAIRYQQHRNVDSQQSRENQNNDCQLSAVIVKNRNEYDQSRRIKHRQK